MKLWAALHEGHGRAGKTMNFFLVMLILISVAILPLEFLPDYARFSVIIHSIEAVIVALFTVEYVLRLYAAPKRLRYAFSFFGIVDLLSIMPFYAGIFGTEYVRALRLVRLFKLAEIEAAAEKDGHSVLEKGMGLLPDEDVQYIVTKSPIVLIIGVIPAIICLSFGIGALLLIEQIFIGLAISISLFLFAFLFLWKTWLDFGYDVIYVTNLRLILQNQHVLGRSVNQVQYSSITNVKPFYPSPLSYIFRYGSLIIDTAAEHPGQISLHMVRRHEQAASCIMRNCFVKK